MSMEITWFDSQLSTENQNGRHLAIKKILKLFLDFPRNLVYIKVFGVCESIGFRKFFCGRKNFKT